MNLKNRLKTFTQENRFLVAIIGVIVFALMMTVISMVIYRIQGVAMLDFSRPGYEKVKNDIKTTKAPEFSTSGPMNTDTIDQFKKMLSDNRKELDSLGHFNNSALDDDQLRLSSSNDTTLQQQ